jgi:hypothetical protein
MEKYDVKPGDLFKGTEPKDYDLAMFLSYTEDGHRMRIMTCRFNFTAERTCGSIIEIGLRNGWVKLNDE